MLKAKLAALVNICTRNAWVVIVIALVLSVFSGIYAAHNFAINTNVNQLISPDLPWRQRELAFVDAFQGNHEQILAVVDAATSERATAASKALAAKLRADPALFPSVQELARTRFARGLLFLPAESRRRRLAQHAAARAVLVADQPGAGWCRRSTFAAGHPGAEIHLDDMVRPPCSPSRSRTCWQPSRRASLAELVNKSPLPPRAARSSRSTRCWIIALSPAEGHRRDPEGGADHFDTSTTGAAHRHIAIRTNSRAQGPCHRNDRDNHRGPDHIVAGAEVAENHPGGVPEHLHRSRLTAALGLWMVGRSARSHRVRGTVRRHRVVRHPVQRALSLRHTR